MAFTPTIAIDFDGVVHTYSKGWRDGTIYDPPIPGALESLRALMDTYAVAIFTTRDVAQVAEWLIGYGFACRTGHEGVFWSEQGELLVTNQKPAAVAYIDDRAVHFTGWHAAMRELAARGYDAPAPSEDRDKEPEPVSGTLRGRAIRAATQALAKVEPPTDSGGDAIDPATRARIAVDAAWNLLESPHESR